MKTYTRSLVRNVRLIGGGTTDVPRCQHRELAGQCLRAAGHGTDNPGQRGTVAPDGHLIRWGTDPE